jgi:hypothetical protein
VLHHREHLLEMRQLAGNHLVIHLGDHLLVNFHRELLHREVLPKVHYHLVFLHPGVHLKELNLLAVHHLEHFHLAVLH